MTGGMGTGCNMARQGWDLSGKQAYSPSNFFFSRGRRDSEKRTPLFWLSLSLSGTLKGVGYWDLKDVAMITAPSYPPIGYLDSILSHICWATRFTSLWDWVCGIQQCCSTWCSCFLLSLTTMLELVQALLQDRMILFEVVSKCQEQAQEIFTVNIWPWSTCKLYCLR